MQERPLAHACCVTSAACLNYFRPSTPAQPFFLTQTRPPTQIIVSCSAESHRWGWRFRCVGRDWAPTGDFASKTIIARAYPAPMIRWWPDWRNISHEPPLPSVSHSAAVLFCRDLCAGMSLLRRSKTWKWWTIELW